MAKALAPRLASVVVLLACLAFPAPARAVGRVLRSSGSSLSTESVRLAVAVSPSASTLWVSLGVSGGPGRFALVIPVAPGTKVDPALDAWLLALDAATAPRIRPPAGVTACGKTDAKSIEAETLGSADSVPPSKVATLTSLSEIATFASDENLEFGPIDADALDPAGAPFLALVYEAKQLNTRTETVRLAAPVASPSLALGLLQSDHVSDVTLYTLGEGRARVAGAAELETDQVPFVWKVLQGETDYPGQRRALLQATQGDSWLIEATGTTPLFGWSLLPSGMGSIEPAVKTYFDRAIAEGASSEDTNQCLAPVWDALSLGKQGAHVGAACAPGLLANVPDPAEQTPCDESPAAGQIAAGTLRCGSADDLALAFAGNNPSAIRVTRALSVIGTATPPRSTSSFSSGPTISPLITAPEADTTGCVDGNAPSGGGGAPNYYGSGGGTGYAGSYGYGAGDGYGQAPAETQPTTTTQVDVSCSGSGNSDSCSGDSSGNSNGNGDTCGGDSSSGSNSSSSSGDTCGGNSSSSSGDGDTCGGNSSSSGDGDTCGSSSSSGDSCGSSGSSGGGDCALGRGRRPPIRVSAFTLALLALAFPLRRTTRRARPR